METPKHIEISTKPCQEVNSDRGHFHFHLIQRVKVVPARWPVSGQVSVDVAAALWLRER